MKKFFKFLSLGLGILLVVFIIAVSVFVNTQPQFGQIPVGKWLEELKSSKNFNGEVFINQIETNAGTFGKVIKTIPDFFALENGDPTDTLPVKFEENKSPVFDSLCFVTWYGHSAFLIELAGKRMLIDPMLSEYPSPLPFGAKRFPYQQPIPIEKLTDIDAVIISHDHYDHLDYETILYLHNKVDHFYTALGVGSHLRFWGIPEEKVTELDWWQEANHDGIRLVSCPARHFSGRGLTDRNTTQWASWVIESPNEKLYFSGDGGYGPHFKEIGEKEGVFDFAMMECGQYNEAWSDIHMMPEQSVQAGIDLNAKVMMPIHWGAFNLSIHSWKDPIERFKKEADRLNQVFIHPIIGERFVLGIQYPKASWWEDLN